MTPIPAHSAHTDFWAGVADPGAALGVLDRLPGAVVFVKDARCRYVFANHTLAARLGLPGPEALRGRTSAEVFPVPLGERYLAQDRAVLAGEGVTDLLELHLYPGGAAGWCLTTKRALAGHAGDWVGVAGVSRDVPLSADAAPGLAGAVQHIQQWHAGPLSVADLARLAGLSVSAFERACRRTFGLTPGQLITRAPGRRDAPPRGGGPAGGARGGGGGVLRPQRLHARLPHGGGPHAQRVPPPARAVRGGAAGSGGCRPGRPRRR